MTQTTHVSQSNTYVLVSTARHSRDELGLTLYFIYKPDGSFNAQSYNKVELIKLCPLLSIAPELISEFIKEGTVKRQGTAIEATFTVTVGGHPGLKYSFTVSIARNPMPLSQAEIEAKSPQKKRCLEPSATTESTAPAAPAAPKTPAI